MNKPLSPRAHGVLDYATVGLTALAPTLLGFPARTAVASRALAGGYLGLSMLTDYPLSVRRVVPFGVHGVVEVGLGAALPFLPRVLGFGRDRRAARFFYGLTAVTAVVAVLTDWSKTDSPVRTR